MTKKRYNNSYKNKKKKKITKKKSIDKKPIEIIDKVNNMIYDTIEDVVFHPLHKDQPIELNKLYQYVDLSLNTFGIIFEETGETTMMLKKEYKTPINDSECLKNAISDEDNFCNNMVFGEFDNELILVLFHKEKGYLFTYFDKQRLKDMKIVIDKLLGVS